MYLESIENDFIITIRDVMKKLENFNQFSNFTFGVSSPENQKNAPKMNLM